MTPNWWEKRFLLYELILAAVLTATFYWWSLGPGRDQVAGALEQNRGVLYGTLASILASLLGFVIAAIAIVLPAIGQQQLALLKPSGHTETLWRVFFSATRSLALAAITALIALLLDRDGAANLVVVGLVFGTTCLAILRVTRVVWVLDKLVRILSKT